MRQRSEIIGNAFNFTACWACALSQSIYLPSGRANRHRRNSVLASDCDPGCGRAYAVAGPPNPANSYYPAGRC